MAAIERQRKEVHKERLQLYTTVFAQSFSPCGNYLAACNNIGKIAVFSLSAALDIDASSDSRLPINVFQAHSGSIYSLASTLKFLISGGPSEIHGWNWKDVIHSRAFVRIFDGVFLWDFSQTAHDRQHVGLGFIIFGSDYTLKAFQDPKPSWTLTFSSSSSLETTETNGLALNTQDNTLISGGGDNKVHIWDLETGVCKCSLSGHKDYIHCVAALQKTNRCISGSEDGTVRIWDCRLPGSLITVLDPSSNEALARPHTGKWISCVVVDDAEDWLICGGGPYLSNWYLRSSTMTSVMATPIATPLSAIFHEEKILTAGTEPKVYHWSANGELITEVPCTSRTVYSLAVNNNSKQNRVLSVAGNSSSIDVCTNFKYKAFSFSFRD